MYSKVWQAFWLPLRDGRAFTGLFWPWLLGSLGLFLAGAALGRWLGPQFAEREDWGILASALVVVGTWSVATLLLLVPIVRWHWFLVHGTGRAAISVSAVGSYLRRWIALNFWFVVCLILVSPFVLVVPPLLSTRDAVVPQFYFSAVLMALLLLTLLAFTWIVQRLVMRLVAAAVESDPLVRARIGRTPLPQGLWLGLFAVGTLALMPTLLESVVAAIVGADLPDALWSDIVRWVFLAIEVVAFATFISLVYRDDFRPRLFAETVGAGTRDQTIPTT